MKKEINNISVKMFRVVDDIAPLVKVDYVDKDAQAHTGLMLLDSGSTDNLLSCEMADSISMFGQRDNGTTKIVTMSGEITEACNVKFSFVMGGRQFGEPFCICDKSFSEILGNLNVIGILGNVFMQKHQLVIDYHDFTFHTSIVNPSILSSKDCDYFFPMEIGLKYYGVPVVPMKQNDKEIVTMADTGATNNIIASQTVKDNNFRCLHMKGTDSIRGLSGSVNANSALVRFNLLSINGDKVEEISDYDSFMLAPDYILSEEIVGKDENGDQIPPIEALIGSSYMAKEGWMLDFGAQIIYKLKGEDCLEEAV